MGQMLCCPMYAEGLVSNVNMTLKCIKERGVGKMVLQ